VGIGGSADGVEAIEQFFANTASDTGLSFVLATHLDPELLRRSTVMPVRPIVDGNRVTADTVYVIPPNRSLVIERDVLRLRAPSPQRGTRRTIDTFFRSLAHEWGPTAVGVVLSGMGSDGASGLRAIKEGGGIALIQDPTSAAFDAMPIAAIDAVTADAVLTPDLLPARIAAQVSSGSATSSSASPAMT
jgi:two-component system CheB/CheR fusion protein